MIRALNLGNLLYNWYNQHNASLTLTLNSRKDLPMNFRFGKAAALTVAAVMLCSALSGCSDSTIKKYKHNVEDGTGHYQAEYAYVTLGLKVKQGTQNSLGEVASTRVLIYDKDGNLISSSPGQKPVDADGSYTYSINTRSIATQATLNFYDVDGAFLGCACQDLGTLGHKYIETFDIDKVYTPNQLVAPTFNLKYKELSQGLTPGDSIVWDAILVTPVGNQDVSDSDLTTWESSDENVAVSQGNGVFNIIAPDAPVTLTVKYANQLSASHDYTTKAAE